MNGYLERLLTVDAGWEPVERRLVLLTGQSSFQSSALSPAQESFLQVVAPGGCAITRMGFPYDVSFDGDGFADAGMMGAAWRNVLQVYWSMGSAAFCGLVARRLQSAMDATSQRFILITGSSGLQLANAAWPRLRLPAGLRLDVIALGPACFGRLEVPATVVQGRRDFWSRMLFRGRVDHFCDGGHLDYWESGELVRALLR